MRTYTIIVILVLMLIACSSSTGPVTIRGTSSSTGSLNDSRIQVAKVQPVKPIQELKTTRLIIESYIDQANRALSSGQSVKAIELAERGLRINRKEPRLYLVLAEAYAEKANTRQSVLFAKQGLRYADKKSSVYRQLQWLVE